MRWATAGQESEKGQDQERRRESHSSSEISSVVALGTRRQRLKIQTVNSETSVGVVAGHAADEANGAIGKDEVRAADVPAREVVHAGAAVAVEKRVVHVRVGQSECGGRIPGPGHKRLARIGRTAPDHSTWNGAYPGSIGVRPGTLTDQDGMAGAVADVLEARRAVAVENAIPVGTLGVSGTASAAGGVTGRPHETDCVAEAIGKRKRLGRHWIGGAQVEPDHGLRGACVARRKD